MSAKSLACPQWFSLFIPTPLKVIAPQRDLRRLFLVDDLVEQLEKEGVEALVLQPFSREFSQVEPEQFLFKYLLQPLAPRAIVVGHDFGFGAKRSGTVSTLEMFCQQYEIELNVIAPVSFDNETVFEFAHSIRNCHGKHRKSLRSTGARVLHQRGRRARRWQRGKDWLSDGQRSLVFRDPPQGRGVHHVHIGRW
jgi:FAD synthase